MNDFIKWCNDNVGFTEAVLSFVGLLISTIAIIVSIKTARLPYRKKVKLSNTFDYYIYENEITSEYIHKITGISINAINVGSRNVNFTFLGLGLKEKRFGSLKKLVKINSRENNMGILKPIEIFTISYGIADLFVSIDRNQLDCKLYAIAVDSEDKLYKKIIGTVRSVKNTIDGINNS